MVKEINDVEFEKVIKEDKIVLVDCFANWCGPCKMLSPVIDKLSEEMKDIKFYKIDVDKSSKVTNNYQIMSIPTLLLFKDGSLINKLIGFRSKSELEEEINNMV